MGLVSSSSSFPNLLATAGTGDAVGRGGGGSFDVGFGGKGHVVHGRGAETWDEGEE